MMSKNVFAPLVRRGCVSNKECDIMSKKAKDDSGFTLVELIVVTIITAVLIGITVAGVTKYIDKARKVMDLNTAREIVKAQVHVLVKPGEQGDGMGHIFFINPNIEHELGDGADSRDFGERVMATFNEYPTSKFDKNLQFAIISEWKDSKGKISYIYLADGYNLKYQLYPNVCKEFQVE